MMTKYQSFLFICSLLFSYPSLGQITFKKTIGGEGDEVVNAVISTIDENFLIVGYSSSFGLGDNEGFVSKVNSSGTEIWSKVIGASGDDEFGNVIQLKNSDFAIVGWSENSNGNEDLNITRITNSGEVVWSKHFGGTENDRAYDIIETSDGNLLISGWSKSFGNGLRDIVILKMNLDGQIIWSNIFGREGNDWCHIGGISEDGDGNYIVVGTWTKDLGINGHNGFLFKLNSQGEIIFSKIFGGNSDDAMNGFIRELDGKYYNIGGTWSWNGNKHEIWINELNKSGGLNWSKTIGLENENIRIGSVSMTSSNDFLISAFEFTDSSRGFGLLIKVDKTGEIIWAKNTGGNDIDKIFSSIETQDGILSFGYTQPSEDEDKDILILKTSNGGKSPVCSVDIPLTVNKVLPNSIEINESIKAIPSDFESEKDFFSNTVEVSETYLCNNITLVKESEILDNRMLNAFPNPNNGFFEVEIILENPSNARLKIYNALGEIIDSRVFSEPLLKTTFNLIDEAPGLYIIELENYGERIFKKLILSE